MIVGLGDITSQVGGWQDPCTAGGLLCPQPENFGASINPCCWSNAASSIAALDANGNVIADNPLGLPPVVSSIPSWAWLLAGAGIVGFLAFKK